MLAFYRQKLKARNQDSKGKKETNTGLDVQNQKLGEKENSEKIALNYACQRATPDYSVRIESPDKLLIMFRSQWELKQYSPAKMLELKQASNAGNPLAQIDYANCLMLGIHVKKDAAAGYELIQRAAATGLPAALLMLAQRYYFGWGIEKNLEEALNLAKKASEQGLIRAYTWIAFFYVHPGIKNPTLSFQYLKKGANLNDPEAIERMAYFHSCGFGTRKDQRIALKYYHMASLILEENPDLDPELSDIKEQIEVVALITLARRYEFGIETSQDNKKVLEYYKEVLPLMKKNSRLQWKKENIEENIRKFEAQQKLSAATNNIPQKEETVKLRDREEFKQLMQKTFEDAVLELKKKGVMIERKTFNEVISAVPNQDLKQTADTLHSNSNSSSVSSSNSSSSSSSSSSSTPEKPGNFLPSGGSNPTSSGPSLNLNIEVVDEKRPQSKPGGK